MHKSEENVSMLDRQKWLNRTKINAEENPYFNAADRRFIYCKTMF